MSNSLDLEADAFNAQITERIRNGYIPDLRRATKNDYFYCNSWRRPAYVRLDFGEIFERIHLALRTHAPKKRELQVLEVGCGPGFMSLELARNGYHTTGIDLSTRCIDIAREVAESDPWKSDRAPLEYLTGDFLTHPSLRPGQFNAVIFIGALHHFSDQQAVGRRVRQLLTTNGIILAHEPTRDRYTEGLCEFIYLLQVLLSVGKGFYKDIPIPTSEAASKERITRIFHALRYETEEGHSKAQSPNDNEAGFTEMSAMLNSQFGVLLQEDTYAFFHEMIGGLRFPESVNEQLAAYLRDVDAALVKHGVLPATEFFFAGRKVVAETDRNV